MTWDTEAATGRRRDAVADRRAGTGAGRAAGGMPSVDHLDRATYEAARAVAATVARYAAAPGGGRGDAGHVEVVVEFLVPPASVEAFARALEAGLRRGSRGYAAARASGAVGPVRVRAVPPGAFHQWRVAWGRGDAELAAARWSDDRDVVEGVLRQAHVGWRELLAI
jgi:hypothetical protein